MMLARSLSYVADKRCVIEAMNLDLKPNEVLAILGPNGAGKTTLLRLLARELSPTSGVISLDGRTLESLSSIELARRRAVLPQSESLRFAFLSHQVVSLGRYPWGGGAGAADTEIVAFAMRAVGVEALALRPYTQLSAGERSRVQLARVLAQIWRSSETEDRYLLLDEPTANLDLAHQHDVLATVRDFAATGVGIVMILHDLNLAYQYADRVLLLRSGRVEATGTPADVLDGETIRRVFDVDVDFLDGGPSSRPWIAARPRSRPAKPGL
jgi:iron complex transport system ATP-binding protein